MGVTTLPTPDQQAWLKTMNQAFGNSNSSNKVSSSAEPITLAFPPRNGGAPPYIGPGSQLDPAFIQQLMEESKKKEEKKRKDAQDALEQARKWLTGLPKEELRKYTYPAIVAKIKEDFPAVADLPK